MRKPRAAAGSAAFFAVAPGVVTGVVEPTPRRRFGAEYEAYSRAVPAWRPRLRLWRS